MTKIIGYSVKQNKEGKSFVTLELQGDLMMVQSQQTSKWYATAKATSITSTFDEETARHLVGQNIPGRIEKVDCLPYDFTIKATGEVIKLSYRHEFVPEGEPTPLRVVKMETEDVPF